MRRLRTRSAGTTSLCWRYGYHPRTASVDISWMQHCLRLLIFVWAQVLSFKVLDLGQATRTIRWHGSIVRFVPVPQALRFGYYMRFVSYLSIIDSCMHVCNICIILKSRSLRAVETCTNFIPFLRNIDGYESERPDTSRLGIRDGREETFRVSLEKMAPSMVPVNTCLVPLRIYERVPQMHQTTHRFYKKSEPTFLLTFYLLDYFWMLVEKVQRTSVRGKLFTEIQKSVMFV